MKPTPRQRIWMYEAMYRSRRFDERVFEAYWEGKRPIFNMGKGPLPGEMHQSFGQEPTGPVLTARGGGVPASLVERGRLTREALGGDRVFIGPGRLATELFSCRKPTVRSSGSRPACALPPAGVTLGLR